MPLAGGLAVVCASVLLRRGFARETSGSRGEVGGQARRPFDEKEALTFVQYSRAAFCTKEAVESWDCGDACLGAPVERGSVRFFGPGEKWRVQGYVARVPSPSGTQCVVSFRGSVPWQNWLADFYVVMRAWPPVGSGRENASWCEGCEVHTGFSEAYEELRPSILASLRELGCESAAVVGHSLGGALASLAVLDIRAGLGMRVDPAYTFGKPRVGNSAYVTAFADAAKKQGAQTMSWRVVHYKDPVPRTPSSISLLPYVHEMHEVFYDKRDSSSYRECEFQGELVNGYEDPTCSWATSLVGCINNIDHVHYLNKTFAHKEMDAKCIGTTLAFV